ncbi:MAG: hypothetical protein ABFC42_07925 [Sulfuricella sp.]
MPVEITWEPHGVYRKFYGSFSHDEMQAAQNAVYGNIRFDELHYIINDYLESDPDTSIDDCAVERATAFAFGAMQTNPRLRFAFVATNPKILQLIEHIPSVPISESVPFEVFSTLADARRWVESDAWYK